MSSEKDAYKHMLRNIDHFTFEGGGMKLYGYQRAPAEAILQSVEKNWGLTFVVIMPRQAGKDEMLTQLTAYLLLRMYDKDRSIVIVNPTYKPQTYQAILRLENRLEVNTMCRRCWRKRAEYMLSLGDCRVSFLSGDGTANVVGATANLLLIVNEAQDIHPAVYDRKFSPMAASRNATRVLAGTAWTSQTLLAREMRAARRAEAEDNRQRLFFATAEEVGRENRRYKRYVKNEIQRLGREHPFVKSQYFCEEIDAQVSMFNPGRLALIQGGSADFEDEQRAGGGGANPPAIHAFLMDLAGQDEARMGPGHGMDEAPADERRDSTTLSIVRVDLSTLETLQAPTYRVVSRRQWTGVNHLSILGQVRALGDKWHPQWFVVDATGVGEGFWALLERSFPGKVLPVKFSQLVKSEIGWRFLGMIETGRFRAAPTETEAECGLPGGPTGRAPRDEEVLAQYRACEAEVLPGPNRTLRWGVPQGRRGPEGGLLHDDFVMADALAARLDQLEWQAAAPVVIIPPKVDPLKEIGRRF